MNLQTGAFGDPSSTETLILFWSKMEELHYPGAGETKKYLEKRLQQEQQRAAPGPADARYSSNCLPCKTSSVDSSSEPLRPTKAIKRRRARDIRKSTQGK